MTHFFWDSLYIQYIISIYRKAVISLKYKPYQAAIHHVHDCEIVNYAVAVRQLTLKATLSLVVLIAFSNYSRL